MQKFANRIEAGDLLADKLTDYKNKDNVIIIALPRGGVPVAAEISKKLSLPLDLLPVRKLGVPGKEEVGFGALAYENTSIIDTEVIEYLSIQNEDIKKKVKEEYKELLRRNEIYRNSNPFPQVKDKVVIIVDDGTTTGVTVIAAAYAIKEKKPSKIVIALPVCPYDVLNKIKKYVDDVVCLVNPKSFYSVGQYYLSFEQLNDEEVTQFLLK